jgi:hypothetical protein
MGDQGCSEIFRQSVHTVEKPASSTVEPVDNPQTRVVAAPARCYHRPRYSHVGVSATDLENDRSVKNSDRSSVVWTEAVISAPSAVHPPAQRQMLTSEPTLSVESQGRTFHRESGSSE